jgi:hypothetical protein
MKGFAQIPAGARGQCQNTFDFTGITGSDSSKELKLSKTHKVGLLQSLVPKPYCSDFALLPTT